MKNIILCADDYGQTTAISQAIIQLLQQKRLSATSCLVTSPLWQEHAQWLKNDNIQADVGLHFNLTEGRPLSDAMQKICGDRWPALSRVLLAAYLKKWDVKSVLAELNAQIDAFAAAMGRLPDYIDGHQHIHQLPVIREAIIKVCADRFLPPRAFYIRCLDDPCALWRLFSPAYFKRVVIQLCGASAFKKQLVREKIAYNSSFAGIYDFKTTTPYRQLFVTFLTQIKDNGLIMCHPGLKDDEVGLDPIFYSRHREYAYLLSHEFLEDCHAHQVVLKRFIHN